MSLTDDNEQLVSLADVAQLARVTRPAVSNWRKRHRDFPPPVRETGAVSLFRLVDIEGWLSRHGKVREQPTARQEVWRVLNVVRGRTTVTRSVEVCLWVLGMYVLNGWVDRSNRLVPEIARRDEPTEMVTSAARVVGEHLVGAPLVFDPVDLVEAGPVVAEIPRLVREYGTVEVCEALVAEASERQGKAGGTAVTPMGIAQLMAALAEPITGLMYDPACGWGNVLVGLAQQRPDDGQCFLAGDDIDPTAWVITAVRLLIHNARGRINQTDADSVVESMHADRVFADPPFGRAAGEWEWIDRSIHHLNPSGRAFHLSPMGLLFRGGRDAATRRRLVSAGSVEAVIALPPGLLSGTGLPVALWVLRRPTVTPDRSKVLLIDGRALGSQNRSQRELGASDIQSVADCYRAWTTGAALPEASNLKAVVVPMDELRRSDARLDPGFWLANAATPDEHVSRIRAATERLRGTSERLPTVTNIDQLEVGASDSVLVRDLVDVVRGVRVPPDILGRGSAPLLRARDLRPDWSIKASTLVDPRDLEQDAALTRPGDVLVFADREQVRAGVDLTGGAIVSSPLQRFRLRAGSLDSALVLAALLTGNPTSGAVALSYADIRDITVSWPEYGRHTGIAEMLRLLAAQREATRQALGAADEVLASVVAALAAGMQPASGPTETDGR
ncbi:N-6 DNA methylase [Kribbella sp. NPDC000426]|uniref:N-6 DNA methylase n=1 Tax=Kribbella sp. NPDC000426 TaxID=3154255 RepID=UPI00331CEA60